MSDVPLRRLQVRSEHDESPAARAAVFEVQRLTVRYEGARGQQQRLCIARCLAVEPEVLLMDEPASALDPISSGRIEDLIHELKHEYAIVIVTHNMQQAARVADRTAFFSAEPGEEKDANPHGVLIEIGETLRIFTSPSDVRTEAYVTGRFG